MKPRPRSGQRYRCDVVSDTAGTLVRDAIITVEKADRLTCGCWRLKTQRPGPPDGPFAGPMPVHLPRCGFHIANPPDGTPDEPQLITGEVPA